MKNIYQIVDSYDYVYTNAQQKQVLRMLQESADSHVVKSLPEVCFFDIKDNMTVLSTLKLRSVLKHVDRLADLLKGTPIWIYEQDAWESWMDDAGFPGAYITIASKLNVKGFLVTSKWWSDYVVSKGLPSKFVKIWTAVEHCTVGKPFNERTIPVGFMGQRHPHRIKSSEAFAEHGINIDWRPTLPLESYLKELQNMKCYIHDEPPRWKLDGKIIPCNSLWGRAPEIISQGCFYVKNYEPTECKANGLDENPLVITFSSYEEARDKINEMLRLDSSKADEMIKTGVDMIKNDIGWKSILEAIDEL